MFSCTPGRVIRRWLLASVWMLAVLPLLALEPSDSLAQYGRQAWQTGSGLPQDTVRAIAQTSDGFLWVGTDEGLARFDGYGFATFTTQNTPELKSNTILSLSTRGPVLLIGTSLGSVRFAAGKFSATTERLTAATSAVLVDRHGVNWEGSASGLIRNENGRTDRFPPSDPLSTYPVLSIFEDQAGDVWVGTDGAGLHLLKNQRFTTFGNDPVRCVYQDRNGDVWLGTDGQGLSRIHDGVISSVRTAEGLSSDVILSLSSDLTGSVLAGTPDGLNLLRDRRVSVMSSADGLPEDFIRSVFTDKDGSVWIGTRRGLAHMDAYRVTTYTQSNGLGSDLVGAMTRDSRGDLWIATLRGLSRFHANSFTNLTVADGLSSNIITDLYADPEGYLWIATQGGGLNRFRDEMFVHFDSHQSLPDTIYGLTEDANGNLWMSSRNGIIRVAKKELNAFAATNKGSIAVAAYGTGDGLRVTAEAGPGHPAIYRDKDDGIWFATARGAAFLSKSHSAVNSAPPPVAIESVLIDDTANSPSAVRDIGAGHDRVSFEYAGIDFAAPQRVRYRYRLEGFDSHWIEAGTRRTAFYTNLPPRHYTFRVMARNGEGLWSTEAAALSFTVMPHFYQTWWFRVWVFACLALAVYAVYTWRVRQVKAQFDAVLQERNRIAREIHDTLAQGFAGVSVQLEVVSRVMSASTDKARQHLDEARTLVRSCLADARRAIWDLRSPESSGEDLGKKLATLVRNLSDGSGTHIDLQIGGVYRAIEPKIEEQFLRIGTEALRNAIRHSGARNISMNVVFTQKSLRMRVADDGRGFDHDAIQAQGPNGHFGLAGMKERAQQIHGTLTVSSAAGRGTEINLEAPVR